MIDPTINLCSDFSDFEFLEMEETEGESSYIERRKSLIEKVSSLATPVIKTVQLGLESIYEYNHPSKTHKYRVVLNDFTRNLQEEVKDLDQLRMTWEERAKDGSSLAGIIAEFLFLISDPKEPRAQYWEFIALLRKLCERVQEEGQDPYLAQAKQFCDICCLIRWSQISIWNYMKGILHVFTTYEENALSLVQTLEEFPDALEKINSLIKGAPFKVKKPLHALAWQKACGSLDIKDFTGTENTPRLRSTLVYVKDTEKKEILFSQHACPTSGKEIVSDYKMFVKAAKRNNYSILYVNHQNIAEEKTRTDAIYALQKNCSNFFELVQPLDGEFFEKEGKYRDMQTLEELKKSLRKEFKEEWQCRLPKNLESREHYRKVVLPELLEQTQMFFFSHNPPLIGKKEWQTFLLLFYVLQSNDLKFRLPNVRYYTTPCKDFLDRGGAMALIEEVLLAGFLKEELITKQQLEWILVNSLASPILVKKQDMIPSRLQFALQVLEHLNQLSIEQKKELKNLHFDGWKFDELTVRCIQGQEALPTLSEARTLDEVTIALENLQTETLGERLSIEESSQYDLFKQLFEDRTSISGKLNGEFLGNTRQEIEKQLDSIELTQEKRYPLLKLFCKDRYGLVANRLQKIFQNTVFHPFIKPDSLLVEVDTEQERTDYEASFLLTCKEPKSPLFCDGKPYAEIAAKLTCNLSGEEIQWHWKVAKIFSAL